MANNPMGDDFIEGSLGVCLFDFDNTALGRTVDEANLEFIEDMKDIFFAQEGTQPVDKIPTGQAYQVTLSMGEATWARLQKLMRGLTVVGHSAKLGRDIYRSGMTNFAKVLKVTRVDSDGAESTDPKYRLTFYKALPLVTAFATFGPDSQRIVEVNFYCGFDSTKKAFGYSGYASSLGL